MLRRSCLISTRANHHMRHSVTQSTNSCMHPQYARLRTKKTPYPILDVSGLHLTMLTEAQKHQTKPRMSQFNQYARRPGSAHCISEAPAVWKIRRRRFTVLSCQGVQMGWVLSWKLCTNKIYTFTRTYQAAKGHWNVPDASPVP
jgi:hypothetical protein